MNGPEPGTPEYWALHRPGTTAIVCGDAEMTYGEWNDRADRVAEGLAALGLQSGDRLGMRFRLGLEWFVVQRALQKLGVAQVAVNWKLTPDEAIYILHDSGAKGLACNDTDASGWVRDGVGLLVTVGQATGAGVRYEDLLETPVQTARYGAGWPDMVLYTSGTTGKPRGVPPLDYARVGDLERLGRYMASVTSVPPYPDCPTTLLTLPIHHGGGPQVVTATVARGGTVIALDHFKAEEALALIDRYRVQMWTAVPTMLLRVQSLPEPIQRKFDLSSLTALTVGAAAVPQSLKEWVVKTFGDQILWESYGASEVGMITYTSPEHQLDKPGTSGRPYDGIEIAIVDEAWDRLPTGEAGEIAVNSPLAFRGYLGSAELGEEVIKDGFYRTGDVGYLDSEGFLYITDRVKDMIVAGGVNIYPAEIEKALVAHPQIVDAAVIGIPDEDFGEKPLAFVVAHAGIQLDEAEVTDFLSGRLASFKKPRQYAFVDELPLSPVGKVLKGELRKPYWEGRARNV